MHLAQSARKDSNGEPLIGLIDAAQAIVMTLLVIEMPVLIIELFEHEPSPQELSIVLTTDIFGYFLAALIIYDIWSLQKSLFQSTQSRAYTIRHETTHLALLSPLLFFIKVQSSFSGAIKTSDPASADRRERTW